jgi:hypothetical protein
MPFEDEPFVEEVNANRADRVSHTENLAINLNRFDVTLKAAGNFLRENTTRGELYPHNLGGIPTNSDLLHDLMLEGFLFKPGVDGKDPKGMLLEGGTFNWPEDVTQIDLNQFGAALANMRKFEPVLDNEDRHVYAATSITMTVNDKYLRLEVEVYSYDSDQSTAPVGRVSISFVDQP